MDIYFNEQYGKLYENDKENELVSYFFESTNGIIKYLFLKREIPIKICESDQKLFDIITPYGYGGPIVVESNDKVTLVKEFKKEFASYCQINNIVSEFIVFHPVLNNAKDFLDMYELDLDRKSVGTDLTYGEDTINKEFSKSTRKQIRRILKEDGITYELVSSPENLENFKKIYYSTMNRKSAADFYYFNDKYFERLLKNFRKEILLCNVYYFDKIIASSLNLLSNKNIYVHLSGTDSQYLKYSPAYLLKYGVVNWGIEKGFELVHYGGGLTNNEDDSLFNFKRKFGENTLFDYYYGKKIWDKDKYELLKEKAKKKNRDFFPIYRSNK